MLVKEIHIEIDNRLQYLNSNRKGVISPELKDLMFNSSMINVIRRHLPSKIKTNVLQGFESNVVLYDNLKELKKSYKATAYVDDTNDSDIHFELGNVSYSRLPADYLDLITSKSNLVRSCSDLTVPITTASNEIVEVLPFTNDAGASPLYPTLTLSTTGIVVNLSLNNITVYNEDAKFMLVDKILYDINVVNKAGYTIGAETVIIKAYWERYDNLYEPNSFIFSVESIGTTDRTAFVHVTLTYRAGLVGTSTPRIIVRNTIAYTVVNSSIKYKQNRLLSSTDAFLVNQDYYGKSDWDSPITFMKNNRLYAIENYKFYVTQLYIDYIGYPQPINYNTNQTTNINNSLINEVIEDVVRRIKAYTADPTYNALINENKINV